MVSRLEYGRLEYRRLEYRRLEYTYRTVVFARHDVEGGLLRTQGERLIGGRGRWVGR